MNTATQMDLIVFPFDVGDHVTVHTPRNSGVDGRIHRIDRELGFYWVRPKNPNRPIIGPVIESELSLRGLHD